MRDFSISDDPAVQSQLDRIGAAPMASESFGLTTIRTLLARLGNPQKRLPPTFHVAGTNGKGSTCAFLRAMLEAQGLVVHTATKPHLVRYNERLRLAGTLVSDPVLAALLKEVLDTSGDLAPSFFEATTAATFLAFARMPADACVIEVGLGGRLDATNVLDSPAACGIATLGLDHETFLLRPEANVPQHPLARIAYEKASIGRPGSPLVTLSYDDISAAAVAKTAAAHQAPLLLRDVSWSAEIDGNVIRYRDRSGDLILPLPPLAGRHQADNAALAAAMLRHQSRVKVSSVAMAQGIREVNWPARLQRLAAGPLTTLVAGREIWLDGGHNPDAGAAIARHFAQAPPVHLIIGMLSDKDPAAIIGPLSGCLSSITRVPVPGHHGHGAHEFAACAHLPVRDCASVDDALVAVPPGGCILIAGSLYLAGDVLRRNREHPT